MAMKPSVRHHIFQPLCYTPKTWWIWCEGIWSISRVQFDSDQMGKLVENITTKSHSPSYNDNKITVFEWEIHIQNVFYRELTIIKRKNWSNKKSKGVSDRCHPHHQAYTRFDKWYPTEVRLHGDPENNWIFHKSSIYFDSWHIFPCWSDAIHIIYSSISKKIHINTYYL